MSTRDVGLSAEERAAAILVAEGFRIVERNVRTRRGEIDVVAYEGGTLCFVEVRYTASLEHGGPLATISHTKKRKIIRAAEDYLLTSGIDAPVRFDVVGLTPSTQVLLRGAFVAG